MNINQVRVVDPVLTTHVRGYRHAERVGGLLFPSVPVTLAAGKVIEFGRESFMLYNARRAPGAATRQIEFGYEGKPFSLVQDSLESKIPREFAREAAVPGVDLGMRATNAIMQSLTLTLEFDQAKLATTPDNYGAGNRTTVATKWDDPDGKPIDDVEAGRQVVRQSCGLYPNVMVLGPKAYSALKNSEQVKDRFRNSDIITAAMLAALFELETVVEGKAVTAADDGTFSDVWGNAAVLAYAPKTPSGLEEPSFGYTYTMVDNPFAEVPYWDGNKKSWIYGVTYERVPVLSGMLAGFLFDAPVSE